MDNSTIYTSLNKQFSNNSILGNITFNTTAGNLVITERDIIGNSIQSWLSFWFNANGVNYGVPANTQVFPDYIINPNTQYQENLEVKSWYGEASPAFDIANFESYIATLQQDPSKVDTDYLIFKYNMDAAGNITIEDVFLKKIWEITCSSNTYSLKVQVKRDVIYNIRPATWYSTRASFSPFNNRKSFVKALAETLIEYRGENDYTKNWYSTIEKGYYSVTGQNL